MRIGGRGRRVVPPLAAMLAACVPCALALNPALDVSQYAHTPWRISDGFARGYIYAIAQTPDGYLWLGTEFGALRFDGVRTLPPPDPHFSSATIHRLLVTRDGTLWIGAMDGLASWKSGKLVRYPEFAAKTVLALLEDRQGTVWAGVGGTPSGRLCAVQKNSVHCFGEDGRLGPAVLSLCEYQGTLLAGSATGLWRWKPDPPKFYPAPGPSPVIYDLIEGDNGALWLAMSGGVRQLVNGKVEANPVGAAGPSIPYRLLRDREGGLWIGTQGGGLLHVHQGRTDGFTSADGLSGDRVYGLFEDREGNIWAATDGGLDRFRDIAVATISVKQGLSSAGTGSVLAAKDGSVWLGMSDGVNRWDHGQIRIHRKRSPLPQPAPQRNARQIADEGLPDGTVQSLFQDSRGRIWVSTARGVAWFDGGRFVPVASVPTTSVQSIAEDNAGDFWIVDLHQGLFQLRNGQVLEQFPWTRLGHKDPAAALAADEVNGGLWIGFSGGSVAYLKNGQIRASYSAAEGLGGGHLNDIRLDREGTLWTATDGGLSRLKNGRIATLSSKNGLPCDAVHWSIEDDAHSLWLKMPCGLVRVARSEWEAWAADPARAIRATAFDTSDGVRSFNFGYGYSPRVAKSTDGKLWFSIFDGFSVVDPSRLPNNQFPPPVQIEQVTADRKPYAVIAGMRLPALIRELQIDYTALSFAAPEKVQFRYMLEGHDSDWVDAGTRRQAFYNDLPPRKYRFRVKAANNSGVWNEAGASLEFSVDPAYYQTPWFFALCVAAVLALLAAAYRLRLRYLKHQFDLRLEERVGERTRIAREFHDTTLQSFQAVLLKLSVLAHRLKGSEIQEALEKTIEQGRQAVTEGRDAVQGLRSSTVVTNELAEAIRALGKDLAAEFASNPARPSCPEIRVEVEGATRALAPIVRDEVHRIACEGVRNACHHAEAQRVEVAIQYGSRRFQLRVRDNGKGIDPKVLAEGGRAGHHGLPGMKERAQLAGGKLTVSSRLGSGTEVELTIPASFAYSKSAGAGLSMSSGQGD